MELTDDTIDGTEQDRSNNEPRVPVVFIVDRRDAEKHEYYRLRTARQHFHRVLDGRVWFVRYIGLYVVLHGYTAKRYSVWLNSEIRNMIDVSASGEAREVTEVQRYVTLRYSGTGRRDSRQYSRHVEDLCV